MFDKNDSLSPSFNDIVTRQVFKVLDSMEVGWTKKQKQSCKERVKAAVVRSKRLGEFLGMVLRKCKIHGGPLTSVEELENFVREKNTERAKKCLRLEIQFQRMTHQGDSQERPDLYKVNGIDAVEMIANLAVLLSSDVVQDQGEDVIFDSEEQIMKMLEDKEEIATESSQKFNPQDPVIVLWDEQNGGMEWYVGFYLDDNDDGTVRIDHLERVVVKDKNGRPVSSDSKWKRPKSDAIQDVKEVQILQCKPVGDWVLESQHVIFQLDNNTEIESLAAQMLQ